MVATETPMNGSILKYLRRMLVSSAEDSTFDTDLIVFGNGALFVINKLGVGPAEGFQITGETETWLDFIGVRKDLGAIQTDVYLRVRLLFDPPQNSFLVKGIQDQIQEYDWRIEEARHDPAILPQATTEE